jgi:hypothetical protein
MYAEWVVMLSTCFVWRPVRGCCGDILDFKSAVQQLSQTKLVAEEVRWKWYCNSELHAKTSSRIRTTSAYAQALWGGAFVVVYSQDKFTHYLPVQ